MHELIAFLLGALALFTGGYVWWTHRRFANLKTIVREVIRRVEPTERQLERHERANDHIVDQLDTHDQQIRFLLADREVPIQQQGRADRDSKQEKTAWDHLTEKLDGI
jgi:hypothetical protein